jgi:hypothetical protein
VTLVSRFHGDATLYAAPPAKRGKTGRPRKKSRKLPTPAQVVAQAQRRRFTVSWYGGQTRRVELVWGEGYWYKAGEDLVPIRWVYVHDLSGTHRDEYFYTTDATLPPNQIVGLFTGRWSIEICQPYCLQSERFYELPFRRLGTVRSASWGRLYHVRGAARSWRKRVNSSASAHRIHRPAGPANCQASTHPRRIQL